MNKEDKKIYFVTGGGTGGHIYPAIAIANELKKDSNVEKIYFVGKPNNLEEKIAKEEGFEFLPINISYMPRKLNFSFLTWAIRLQAAIWKALFYIYKYKPNAVFGTGGYVSAPAVMAAILSNTPSVIHDSDANPGIVSRYVAQGVKLVSLAFEEAKVFIKNDNIKVYGNPIKQEFFTITKEDAQMALNLNAGMTLLVMGGSQGAASINNVVIESLKYLTEDLNLNVILQTGNKNFQEVINQLEKLYPEYKENSKIIVQPYFSNMSIPLKAADIVIARAGSLSLSEIAAVEVPSILIPYPHAAADHQRKNARCYETAGASIYIEDSEFNRTFLENTIKELLDKPQKLEKMKNSVKKFCKPNATIEIATALKEIAK